MANMANRIYTHWSREGLKTCIIVLLMDYTLTTAENLSIWKENEGQDGSTTSRINVIDPSSWWDAAEGGCEDIGGRLYLPHKDNALVPEVIKLLEVGTSYWVGGVQNSRWIWTSDDTPLYSYLGHSDLPHQQSTRIQGNSAFKCHLHCVQYDKTVFGLRGDECYCLSESDVAPFEPLTDQTLVQCAGNYEEYCGDDTGISVYKIDVIDLIPDEEGQCVYVVKNSGNRLSFFQDDNCLTRRYPACHKPVDKPRRCNGNVCTHTRKKSWEEASGVCKLLKVTASNKDSLSKTMARLNLYNYWVGLRRRLSRKWINGTTVASAYDLKDDLDTCLSVERTRGSQLNFRWIPCQDELPSICQTGVTDNDGVSPTPTSNLSVNTSSPDPQPVDAAETNNTGSSVGAVVGCLVAVGVCVAVIIMMQRKKKFCFAGKPDSPKASAVKSNNITRNNDDPYYSTLAPLEVTALPTAVVRPNIHLPPNDNLKPNIYKQADDTYYSTPTYSNTSTVPIANAHKDQPIYVNDPKNDKEVVYNTFTDNVEEDFNNHAYSHVCVGDGHQRDRGDYDVANAASTQDITNENNTEPLYLVLENDQEYQADVSPQKVQHVQPYGRGITHGEGEAEVDHPRLYSFAAQSPNEQKRGNERVNIYSGLDNNSADENVYRHIGDNGCGLAGHVYEVAHDMHGHTTTVSSAVGADMYTLADQTDISPIQNGLARDGNYHNGELGTDYLLQDNVSVQDSGLDNVYSLANDSSTA